MILNENNNIPRVYLMIDRNDFDLEKAVRDRSNLVQVERMVQRKTGTHPQKFWIKPDSVQKGDKVIGNKHLLEGETKGETKGDFKAEFAKLAKAGQRDKALELAKKNGVQWVECDNKGINWMRLMMAVKVHKNTTPVQPDTTPDTTQDNRSNSLLGNQNARGNKGNTTNHPTNGGEPKEENIEEVLEDVKEDSNTDPDKIEVSKVDKKKQHIAEFLNTVEDKEVLKAFIDTKVVALDEDSQRILMKTQIPSYKRVMKMNPNLPALYSMRGDVNLAIRSMLTTSSLPLLDRFSFVQGIKEEFDADETKFNDTLLYSNIMSPSVKSYNHLPRYHTMHDKPQLFSCFTAICDTFTHDCSDLGVSKFEDSFLYKLLQETDSKELRTTLLNNINELNKSFNNDFRKTNLALEIYRVQSSSQYKAVSKYLSDSKALDETADKMYEFLTKEIPNTDSHKDDMLVAIANLMNTKRLGQKYSMSTNDLSTLITSKNSEGETVLKEFSLSSKSREFWGILQGGQKLRGYLELVMNNHPQVCEAYISDIFERVLQRHFPDIKNPKDLVDKTSKKLGFDIERDMDVSVLTDDDYMNSRRENLKEFTEVLGDINLQGKYEKKNLELLERITDALSGGMIHVKGKNDEYYNACNNLNANLLMATQKAQLLKTLQSQIYTTPSVRRAKKGRTQTEIHNDIKKKFSIDTIKLDWTTLLDKKDRTNPTRETSYKKSHLVASISASINDEYCSSNAKRYKDAIEFSKELENKKEPSLKELRELALNRAGASYRSATPEEALETIEYLLNNTDYNKDVPPSENKTPDEELGQKDERMHHQKGGHFYDSRQVLLTDKILKIEPLDGRAENFDRKKKQLQEMVERGELDSKRAEVNIGIHGCNNGSAMGILGSGVNISLSGNNAGQMLGAGHYLSNKFGKSIPYCGEYAYSHGWSEDFHGGFILNEYVRGTKCSNTSDNDNDSLSDAEVNPVAGWEVALRKQELFKPTTYIPVNYAEMGVSAVEKGTEILPKGKGAEEFKGKFNRAGVLEGLYPELDVDPASVSKPSQYHRLAIETAKTGTTLTICRGGTTIEFVKVSEKSTNPMFEEGKKRKSFFWKLKTNDVKSVKLPSPSLDSPKGNFSNRQMKDILSQFSDYDTTLFVSGN